jgi:murein DD-endopeptidase MepM/ murein hydrolase activator NlpD
MGPGAVPVLTRLAVSGAVALTLAGAAAWLAPASSAPQAAPLQAAAPSNAAPAPFDAAQHLPRSWRTDVIVPVVSSLNPGEIAPLAAPVPQVTEAPLPTDPIERRVVSLRSGSTILDLLAQASVSREDAQGAVSALRSVFDPRHFKAGQEFAVLFDRTDGDRFVGFEFQPAVERAVSVALDGDQFQASETKKKVEKRLVAAKGTIDSSLFEAGSAAGVPIQVLSLLMKQYSYDVDFQRDIQPGDKFEILYERYVTEDGEVARDGAIRYASLTLSGKRRPIYQYEVDGITEFFNKLGESVRRALLKTPVDGARLSSGFGMRHHPVLGYSKMHKGIDFAAPTGTPVYAAGQGVVEEIGPKGSFGNYVRIRHNTEFSTAYAHLSRFGAGMHKGERVSQGDIIGYIGTTGRSTGPHLHYEVLRRDQQINPTGIELPTGRNLDGKELKQFQAQVARLDEEFGRALQGETLVAAPDAEDDAPRIIPAAFKRKLR